MADSREWQFFVNPNERIKINESPPGRPKPILGAIPFGGSLSIVDTHKMINEAINNMNLLDIDGAYLYGNEEIYSTDYQSIKDSILKAQISTKVTPMFALNNRDAPFNAEPTSKNYIGLSEDGVKKQFYISLNKLKRNNVSILYLHWMDINIDIGITLKAINDLYLNNKFKYFGLCNFYSWQVSRIYEICKLNNYVLPTIYQGHYNPLSRDIEHELIPCLRYYNIKFYAFGVLANGLLAGGYTNKYDKDLNDINREGRMNVYFSKHIYWRKSYFKAFDLIKKACDDVYGINNVNYANIVYRWMVHHSSLGKDDGIICGISQYKYFKPTINAIRYGEPLDNKVVKAFDEAWLVAKRETRGYLQWNTPNGVVRTDDPFVSKWIRSRL